MIDNISISLEKELLNILEQLIKIPVNQEVLPKKGATIDNKLLENIIAELNKSKIAMEQTINSTTQQEFAPGMYRLMVEVTNLITTIRNQEYLQSSLIDSGLMARFDSIVILFRNLLNRSELIGEKIPATEPTPGEREIPVAKILDYLLQMYQRTATANIAVKTANDEVSKLLRDLQQQANAASRDSVVSSTIIDNFIAKREAARLKMNVLNAVAYVTADITASLKLFYENVLNMLVPAKSN